MTVPKLVIGSFLVALVVVGGAWLAVEFLAGGGTQDGAGLPDSATAPGGPAQDSAARPEVEIARVEAPTRVESPAPQREATQPASPVDGGEQAGTIEGTILDDRNAPVFDAEVELAQGPALIVSMPSLRNSTGRSMRTDSAGFFRFENLQPAKDYIVLARHAELGESVLGPVELGPGQVLTVPDITLDRGKSVFGTVLCAGRPIGDALVTIESTMTGFLQRGESAASNEPTMLTTKTAADGTYAFATVPIKNFQVTAEAEGYARITQQNRNFLSSPDDQEINFELGPEQTLTGFAVSDSGTPVGGAEIVASLSGKNFRCESKTVSGADGQFFLDGLAEGQYHVVAKAEGYSPATKPRVEAGSSGVEVVLLPQGTIAGRVFDDQNRPIPAFEVVVLRSLNGRAPSRTGISQTVNDANGSFRVGGLDPNSYVIEARAAGFAPTQSEECVVSRGKATEGVDVYMNRGGSVSGTLVDGDGQPVRGALVSLNPNRFKWNPVHDLLDRMSKTDSLQQRTRTDAAGEFLLELIIPGTYQVAVKHRDFAPFEQNDIEIQLNQDFALGEIALLSGGSVEGFAYDESGVPLVGATINANSKEQDFFTTMSDRDGRFSFTGLTAGEYTFTIGNYTSAEPKNVLVQMLKARNSAVQVEVVENGQQIIELRLSSESAR